MTVLGDNETYAVRALDIVKNYDGRIVVNKPDLKIRKGEIYALLGSNGAGKTTLIKMICGLLSPTSGDALINGFSIVRQPMQAKRTLNLSPQETAATGNMTVEENLTLVARLYGADKAAAKLAARRTAEKMGLADRFREKAKKLSGGLCRRLSIGMALVSAPETVFLDEPTLGLDVRARQDLRALLKGLEKDGLTIVLTTHYLEEAEQLADRIGILDKGRLLAEGTADGLKTLAGAKTLEQAFLSLTGKEGTEEETGI